jgi:hypothetical protein
MIARRAGRMLTGRPNPSLQMSDPDSFRAMMREVGVAILQAPTTLSDDDIVFGP